MKKRRSGLADGKSQVTHKAFHHYGGSPQKPRYDSLAILMLHNFRGEPSPTPAGQVDAMFNAIERGCPIVNDTREVDIEARDPSTDVYVTLWRGDRYHSRDCRLLGGSESLQIHRIALMLAKSLGYKSCEICKPAE